MRPIMINTNDDNINNETPKSENSKYLVNDENFKALIKTQADIYDATEMKISLRKLINQVITVEALDEVKSKIIRNINQCMPMNN